MERNLGVYRSLNEACFDWAQKWGLSLAYALTQNVDTAEQVAAEAMVGVLASPHSAQEDFTDVSDLMMRYAATLFHMGERRAFRGFAHDEFFKMPITVRAAVILKIKAKFSRRQIAVSLGTSVDEVDSLLENARLAFTKGKPWLSGNLAKRQLNDAKLIAPCPDLKSGTLFAHYLENDLNADETMRLHKHFVACVGCRANLLHFKNTYSDWLFTLPEVELTKPTINYLRRTSVQALQARNDMRRNVGPSPVPGLKKLMVDRQTQVLLLSFAVFLFLLQVFRG